MLHHQITFQLVKFIDSSAPLDAPFASHFFFFLPTQSGKSVLAKTARLSDKMVIVANIPLSFRAYDSRRRILLSIIKSPS